MWPCCFFWLRAVKGGRQTWHRLAAAPSLLMSYMTPMRACGTLLHPSYRYAPSALASDHQSAKQLCKMYFVLQMSPLWIAQLIEIFDGLLQRYVKIWHPALWVYCFLGKETVCPCGCIRLQCLVLLSDCVTCSVMDAMQVHLQSSQPLAYRKGLRQLVVQAQQNMDGRLRIAYLQVSSLIDMRLIDPTA